jgi:ABC-type multidrug transport system fused ATPase/permease subunit
MHEIIFQFVKKFKFFIGLLVLAAISESFLSIYVNKHVEFIIDSIEKNPGKSIASVILSFVFYKSLHQGMFLFKKIIDIKLWSENIRFSISELFLKISKYSLGFFSQNSSAVTARKIEDFEYGARYVIFSLYSLINQFFYLIFSIIALFQINKKVGWYELTFLIFFFICQYFLSKILTILRTKSELSKQKSNSKIQNSFANIFLIKILGNFDYFFQKNVKNFIEKFSLSEKKYMQFDSFVIGIYHFLFVIFSTIFQIFLLSGLIKKEIISAGAFAFGFSLIIGSKLNLQTFTDYINYNLSWGLASINSAKEIFHDPFNVKTNPHSSSPQNLKGDIHFKNVCFSYPGESKQALKNINLEIKAGEKIGIIGFSGSGKSTLMSALLRCFDVETGEILLDGENIKDLNLDLFWSQIGIISQETSILHNSILENLLIVRPDATFDEIQDVCKKVMLHDDISAMQNGYETILNSDISNLSGGQRQRIGIARVLLNKPSILILDEATSALDPETENKILNLFEEIFHQKDVTIISITHKLENLKNFDRIIMMKDGEIVETGDYEFFSKKGFEN